MASPPMTMNALRRYLLITIFGLALLALATRHWWASRGSRTGGRWGTSTSEAGTWKVEAKVEQIHGRHPADESERVTVVLRDAKGRELETPGIGFSLDETPLVYRVGTGNYYDRHPYYRLDRDSKVRIAPDTEHQLTMTRSNAPAIAFAQVRTPTSLSASNFQVPPRHARDRDLVVAWSGLRQSAEVLIYRTVESADGQGNVTRRNGGKWSAGVRSTSQRPRCSAKAGAVTLPANCDDSWEAPSSFQNGTWTMNRSDHGKGYDPRPTAGNSSARPNGPGEWVPIGIPA